MSFSLLRLPKRAALTALQGLVAGTSCAILLFTDDRRRRINQARAILKNAERIRAAKQYHGTRSTSRRDSVASTDKLDALTPSADSGETYNSGNDALEHRSDASDDTQEEKSQTAGVAQSEEPSTPRLPGQTRSHSPAQGLRSNKQNQISPLMFSGHVAVNSDLKLSTSRRIRSSDTNVDIESLVGRLKKATAQEDEKLAESAIKSLNLATWKLEFKPEERDVLINTAKSLCLECQNRGSMSQAALVLRSVVELGPLTEQEYYDCNPQPVIEHVVSVVADNVARLRDKCTAAGPETRITARKDLELAVSLLLPRFSTDSASILDPNWPRTSTQLMNMALFLDKVELAADIFWRIQHYSQDPGGLITLQFMESLTEGQNIRRVVNTFNLVRGKLVEMTPTTWYAIGNLVTDAVDKLENQDPAKVLRGLFETCPGYVNVRTTWATKLLYCQWRRTKNFQAILDLFSHLEKSGFLDKVQHLDGVYRVMLQISVEAEQWEAVDSFVAQLQIIKPSSCKDARILGLLALAKAKAGDWSGVWEEFEKMEVKDRIHDVFVPVLKEFTRTHTTGEIEDFLRSYVQDLEIPINPYMVNLVANRYGAIRDANSFAIWLEFCSSKGLKVDAAFSNAIIANCRRRWNFSFESLRTIYRTLAALCPQFTDHVTTNSMVLAGIRAHRYTKPTWIRRHVAILGAQYLNGAASRKAVDPEDLRISMRHAFVTRNYSSVQRMYKTALKRGLSLDEGHLRIAVNATIKDKRDMPTVLDLIVEGKKKGWDVRSAAEPVFLSQLQLVYQRDTSDKDEVLREVQGLLAQFEASGLSVSAAALLRCAHLCLRIGHFPAAVSFAMSSLERKGSTYPHDIPTFQLFIIAYAHSSNVKGMKWTIEGAYHSEYYGRKGVYTALKDARKILQKQIKTREVREALWVVEEGLDRLRLTREKNVEERAQLERDTIEIMKRAALERDQPDDEEVVRRRDAMLQELEERQRREQEAEEKKKAQKAAEMEARSKAAQDFLLQNQVNSGVMESMLMGGKYEVEGNF